MKLIWINDAGETVVTTADDIHSVDLVANLSIPEGIDYVVDESIEPTKRGKSIGRMAWHTKDLRAKIAAVQAEPKPDRPAYPDQPQDTETERRSDIATIKASRPKQLPVNEPLQTQKDIENAIANANANADYNAAVAQAEQGFKPYAGSLAEWQAECDKVDAVYAGTLAEFATKQSERIAQLQSQINQLTAE